MASRGPAPTVDAIENLSRLLRIASVTIAVLLSLTLSLGGVLWHNLETRVISLEISRANGEKEDVRSLAQRQQIIEEQKRLADEQKRVQVTLEAHKAETEQNARMLLENNTMLQRILRWK